MPAPRIIGRSYDFEYHCDESVTSSDYILFQHTRQPALVLRRLPPSEVDEQDVGRMYEVCFADGLRWCVFEDELLRIRKPTHRRHE